MKEGFCIVSSHLLSGTYFPPLTSLRSSSIIRKMDRERRNRGKEGVAAGGSGLWFGMKTGKGGLIQCLAKRRVPGLVI